MKKTVYLRGKMSGYMLNTTELFAYPISHRNPDCSIITKSKVYYANGKQEYINFSQRRDLKDRKKPLFVYIHGGGFVSGITKMRDTYVNAWAEMGFFTANIGYTYAPEKTYKDQLKELFSALDFILDRKNDFNIDPSNTVFAGESAGGYYIMCCENGIFDSKFLEDMGVNFHHKDEIKIKGLVSNCGCFNLPNLLDKNKKQSNFPGMNMMVSSLIGKTSQETKEFLRTEEGMKAVPKIHEGFAPVFVISACFDPLKYEAEDLKTELRNKNIKFGEYLCSGIIGMHAWCLALTIEPGRRCLDAAKDFILPLLPDYFEKKNDRFIFRY